MNSLSKYQLLIDHYIEKNPFDQAPQSIYEPINYMLSMGGKRTRPALCLLSVEMFEGDLQKALKPAIAFEFFHNFTLIHDDIMDHAPLRRGKSSVHKKWSENAAILSGDLLLIKAYQLLECLDPETFYKVIREFSATGVKVCQGQQMDMNLEESSEPHFQEYIQMITYKTAALIGSSLKVGALLAGADEKQANYLYQAGKNIGIAFQIQDDLLDVFGEARYVGKKHAGDIHTNKKTILYFKALEKAKKVEKQALLYWYGLKTDHAEKIHAVEEIFKKLDVKKEIEKELIHYQEKSLNYLSKVKGNKQSKQLLVDFSKESLTRLF